MFTTEQRPTESLKVADCHLRVFGMPQIEVQQAIADRIHSNNFYEPLIIAAQPDSDDGKYPVLKGVPEFLAMKDLLGYKTVQAATVDVAPEDQPMRMIFLNERITITRHNLVNMLPIMEEYYDREIRPTRPNNRDHNRDKHVWMSEQCKKLSCPIGVRGIEKLKYINEHRPALLDLLGVDNPIHPIWKKLFDEMEGVEASVGNPETGNDTDVSNPDQESGNSELLDDEETGNDDSPHGQEKAMKEYFGKQFCNTCRANWIWFNRINHIEPLEGGSL